MSERNFFHSFIATKIINNFMNTFIPRLILLFIFIILQISALPKQQQSEKSIEVNLREYKLNISWNVDWDLNTVDLKIQSNVPHNDNKWILIGFADHHDVFENTDFCIFVNGKLWDGWIELNKNKLLFQYDFHQDCLLVSDDSKFNIGFTFQRKFLTCDVRDYAIEPGTTNFVIAIGEGDPHSLNDSSVLYDMRYNQLLQWNKPSWKLDTTGADVLEIKADSARVPSDVTTYWCITVELNEMLKMDKHHIIEIEALITPGNENLVHHMEIFHCQEQIDAEYNGNCNYKPKNSRLSSCSKVIAAWAMGAGAITYPPEAGMPLGGKDFNSWVMVEIHYNNVEQKAGVIDNSGFRITYTKDLRPYDAAIMELGLIYSDANSIPPRQDEWPINSYCVADCTAKGDVLSTTCVYRTTGRQNWTWGGYGIEDEMCVNYIYYYPATEVEVCKSAVDNSTLHKFFTAFGVKNQALQIHEKYLSVKWSERRYKFLSELYSSGNLNIHCLNRSGELFTGHKSNWTNVPQPEKFAGAYEKDRARYDCPSINDS